MMASGLRQALLMAKVETLACAGQQLLSPSPPFMYFLFIVRRRASFLDRYLPYFTLNSYNASNYFDAECFCGLTPSQDAR